MIILLSCLAIFEKCLSSRQCTILCLMKSVLSLNLSGTWRVFVSVVDAYICWKYILIQIKIDKNTFSDYSLYSMPWISGDLKPDTRENTKLCVYEASFPALLKHFLNCRSHLSNCIISFIFLLLCPEYESIMSCGCPTKLSLAPWNRFH